MFQELFLCAEQFLGHVGADQCQGPLQAAGIRSAPPYDQIAALLRADLRRLVALEGMEAAWIDLQAEAGHCICVFAFLSTVFQSARTAL